ncbi:N-acetyltransferase [Bradyrhizobium sp. 24]|nr:GNAT family N-acetyltransferase [Bradyrhizobium sp. 134]MCK1298145.1 N-acetyltransferase [Bradyrhizobium sp. 37]MCK1377789.1 N-acetyltransferase [Bradyrhizobium sp. 24]MCK1773171.1 N-acetyltransferase [Bradyrhizobium sp. 134]
MTEQRAVRNREDRAKLLATITPHENEALAFLLPLSADYPGFEDWYLTRVVPGLRNRSRQLVRIERDGSLIGVGIGKKDETESKICTVRIAESHFGRGLGLRVFDALLDWLGSDRPHLTVSESKLPAFERIFEYYKFQMTSAHTGLYVRDAVELAYNELESSSTTPSKLSSSLASAKTNGTFRCVA